MVLFGRPFVFVFRTRDLSLRLELFENARKASLTSGMWRKTVMR